MDEELKELIKKNNEMLEEILAVSKKTKSFIVWQHVSSAFKILIFVVPTILGIIYLPSILESLLAPYQELMNMGDQASQIDPALLEQVSPDLLKKFLK